MILDLMMKSDTATGLETGVPCGILDGSWPATASGWIYRILLPAKEEDLPAENRDRYLFCPHDHSEQEGLERLELSL